MTNRDDYKRLADGLDAYAKRCSGAYGKAFPTVSWPDLQLIVTALRLAAEPVKAGEVVAPVDGKPVVVGYCQPMDCGKHTPQKFMIYFDDPDHGIMVFDNEIEARAAFARKNTSWNCYLFATLPLYAAPPTPDTSVVAMREAFDRPVKFEECSTPEPSLRQVIRSWYDHIGDPALAQQYADRFIEAIVAANQSDGGPSPPTAGGFPVAATPSHVEETGVILPTRQGAGIERGMDQCVTGGESAATPPTPPPAEAVSVDEVAWQPTVAQISSASLSFRHDYGLLHEDDRRQVQFEAVEWLRAWQKEGFGCDSAEVIERCAAVVDQCNREGPYQAITAAGRIRALLAKFKVEGR